MSPVGFEPTISAGERPQTYALDRAATGTGSMGLIGVRNILRITRTIQIPSLGKIQRLQC
jgi:hypothetical protein